MSKVFGWNPSSYGLENHGLRNLAASYWNLSAAEVYEHALRNGEGQIAHMGPLVVMTTPHTGRSPDDKFIVDEPSSRDKVWWGKINRPISEDKFEQIRRRLLAYLQGRTVYVQDCYGGTDPEYRVALRVITEYAWHALFARHLFVRPDWTRVGEHVPEYTVLCAPGFCADPEIDGTRTGTFILMHFGRRLILIGGTRYAGEIKKSIFTLLNYLLPQRGVLPMHCSANMGPRGDVAVFFGLSGTGKTTLSADPTRSLIGDDEHGWTDQGVFNFEGGCYAKVIRISPDSEPEIYACTRRFGTILENVVMNPVTRRLEFDNASITENTRAAYPVSYIPRAELSGRGGHPSNIIMLTCDAFGVMPPVARLSQAEAMFHFLTGYTAKVAGTEAGLGAEPQATFSTCFGAPFMVLHPGVYARMLGEKIERHKVDCWLVNTGWTGGPFGVGQRMWLKNTRSIIRAILEGSLRQIETRPDPIFGLQIPRHCPGVPDELLRPRNTWANPAEYDARARSLREQFIHNFEQFASEVPEEVRRVAQMVPTA
jgi:phosphoenolpyruvate carboxykinase (ATP)